MRFEFSGLLPFNPYVPNSFLGNFKLFFTSPFRPIWFLTDLFLFFTILWLTKIISKNHDVIWYILLSVSVVLLVAASYFLEPYIPDAAYYFSFYALFVFGFFAGKIISHPNFRDKKWFVFFIIVAVTSYICHLLSVISLPGSSYLTFWCNSIRCTAIVFLGAYLLDLIKGLDVIKRVGVYGQIFTGVLCASVFVFELRILDRQCVSALGI